jgi:hypothetical protein
MRFELVDAFVDRKHAADAEQQQGDQERPEIQDHAVAERMIGRRRAPGVAHANQQ